MASGDLVSKNPSVKFPSAANMKKLQWDDNLGKLAQNWAKQCKFEHDSRDNRALKESESVGQNLYKAQ